MKSLFFHLVLPFQWLLGGACAEPTTRLGTVLPDGAGAKRQFHPCISNLAKKCISH
ncbi:MAG: hypothetical protein QGH24_04735 [Candidatus Marinimicrobia bacterium]|nr:hypothetical protein [Candidatus Neomarinimicrobiota bacterium]